MRKIGAIVAVAGFFALPLTVHAQGIPGDATRDAKEGGEAAGPLGAAVGGVVVVSPAAQLPTSVSVFVNMPCANIGLLPTVFANQSQ